MKHRGRKLSFLSSWNVSKCKVFTFWENQNMELSGTQSFILLFERLWFLLNLQGCNLKVSLLLPWRLGTMNINITISSGTLLILLFKVFLLIYNLKNFWVKLLLKIEFLYISLRAYHDLYQEVTSWITREPISMILRAICIWMVSKYVSYKGKWKITID